LCESVIVSRDLVLSFRLGESPDDFFCWGLRGWLTSLKADRRSTKKSKRDQQRRHLELHYIISRESTSILLVGWPSPQAYAAIRSTPGLMACHKEFLDRLRKRSS
jgi:hypothetical protein